MSRSNQHKYKDHFTFWFWYGMSVATTLFGFGATILVAILGMGSVIVWILALASLILGSLRWIGCERERRTRDWGFPWRQ